MKYGRILMNDGGDMEGRWNSALVMSLKGPVRSLTVVRRVGKGLIIVWGKHGVIRTKYRTKQKQNPFPSTYSVHAPYSVVLSIRKAKKSPTYSVGTTSSSFINTE